MADDIASTGPTPASTSSPSTTAPASPPAAGADSSSSGQGPGTGATTSAEPGKKPTLLDAVLKVVPESTESDVLEGQRPDAPPSPTDSGEQAAQDGQSDEDDAATDEPSATDPPVVRKKINKLLKQRRELRDEVARLQPVAEIGGQLANFATENDLSSDDVVRAISLAAAVRAGDWLGFYQQVGPFVRRAQEYLGLVLPDDLGQRVQQGHMTEAAAREYAKTRFDAGRAQAIAQQRETEIHSTRLQGVQRDVQRAVSTFESRLAASDPDYRAKADAIRRTTQAMLHERGGQITSVKDALDIVQAAHAEVTSQYRRLLPTPRATNPVPNGNSQQPAARAAPKTLYEAAVQGLERARAGRV